MRVAAFKKIRTSCTVQISEGKNCTGKTRACWVRGRWKYLTSTPHHPACPFGKANVKEEKKEEEVKEDL